MQVIPLPAAVEFRPADGLYPQVLTGGRKALAAQPTVVVAQGGQAYAAIPAGQRGLLRGLGAIGKITVNMQIDKHGRILLRGNGFPTVYHLGRKKASRGHLLAGVHHFVPKHRQNVCYL